MKDYLIVGFGLAGLSMASVLERRSHSFEVIDTPSNVDHRVVGGMFNPIILKRFSPAWRAHDMWLQSKQTYQYFENKFQQKFILPFTILRILHSVEEQNNWIVASDKAVMKDYMTTPIFFDSIDGIEAPFGFGKMKNVGRVAGEEILENYQHDLKERQLLIQEKFDYNALKINENDVEYKGRKFKKVVFAEGSYVVNNPYFNYLPMKVSKGEMLIIHVPGLKLEATIKSKVFMVPVGNNLYIVGSTYHWDDPTNLLTVQGKEELETKLKTFLKLPYQVMDYRSGIRPTVSDRRPLIGQHPQYKALYVLNGLGTRGIIYAPALAENLYDYLEKEKPIDKEMSIERFENLYMNA